MMVEFKGASVVYVNPIKPHTPYNIANKNSGYTYKGELHFSFG